MTDTKQEAAALVAEIMQGYHSVERMIDIVHKHLLIQHDVAYRAGREDTLELDWRKRKAR